MRERGSNTARPTEKGVGGLPIRSIRSISARRFGRVLSISARMSCRFGRFGRFRRVDLECCLYRDSVDFGASIRSISVDFVAICGLPLGVSVDSVDFGRVASIRSRRSQAQTQKKPDSSIGESGSAIARRRALLTFDSVDFGASIRSCRFGRVASCRVDSVASCRFGRVLSIWSAAYVASCRFGASIRSRFGRFRSRSANFLLSFRADSVASRRSQGANTKKSPIPQSGNRAQLSQGVARS